MKKVLSLFSLVSLLAVLGFSISTAVTADVAIASGKIIVDNAPLSADANRIEIMSSMAPDAFWSAQGTDLPELTLGINGLPTENFSYDLNIKNTKETTCDTCSSFYKIVTHSYDSLDPEVYNMDSFVIISTDPNMQNVDAHIYGGPLKDISSEPFEVFPTIVDEDGNIISQEITNLYFRVEMGPFAEGEPSGEINYQLEVVEVL